MNMWMDCIHVIMVIIYGFHVLIRWFYYIWVWSPPTHQKKTSNEWIDTLVSKHGLLMMLAAIDLTRGFPSYLWVPEGITVLHPAGNTLELHFVMIGEKTEEMT